MTEMQPYDGMSRLRVFHHAFEHKCAQASLFLFLQEKKKNSNQTRFILKARPTLLVL